MSFGNIRGPFFGDPNKTQYIQSDLEKYVHSYICENEIIPDDNGVVGGPLIIGPNTYHYTSKIILDPRISGYKRGDLLSLVYLKVQDIYSTAGQIIITTNNPAAGENASIAIRFGDIQTPEDLIAEFKISIERQWPATRKIYMLANPALPNQFVNFCIHPQIDPAIGGDVFTITCQGPLRQIIGFHQQQFVLNANVDIQLTQDSNLKIQRLKLISDQVRGNFVANTILPNGVSQTVFQENVLAVVDRESQFQFQAKNLDVHMLIQSESQIIFKLVDQDEKEFDLARFSLQVQTYDPLYFSEGQRPDDRLNQQVNKLVRKRHDKFQMYATAKNKNVLNLRLNDPVKQIAISQASGRLDSLLFTRRASYMRMFKFIPSNVIGIKALNAFQTDYFDENQPLPQLGGLMYYLRPQVGNDEQLEKLYTDVEIYLYDLNIFASYRDKFIDLSFFTLFQDWLNAYYDNKLMFNLDYRLADDTMRVRITETTVIGGVAHPENICFYSFNTNPQSLLFGILKTEHVCDQMFAFNNLDNFSSDGRGLFDVLEELGYIDEQTNQIENFYINFYNESQRFPPMRDRNGNLYLFSKHYTLSNILLTWYCQYICYPLVQGAKFHVINQANAQRLRMIYHPWRILDPIILQMFISQHTLGTSGAVQDLQVAVSDATYLQDCDNANVGLNYGEGLVDIPVGLNMVMYNQNIFPANVDSIDKGVSMRGQSVVRYVDLVARGNQPFDITYDFESNKLFQYVNDVYIYIDGIPDCIGVLSGKNMQYSVINKDIWCWKFFQKEVRNITIRFLTKNEGANGQLIEREGALVPDILMRFLVK